MGVSVGVSGRCMSELAWVSWPTPYSPTVIVKSKSTGKGWSASSGTLVWSPSPALPLSQRPRHQQRKGLCLPVPPSALEASGKEMKWHPQP